MRKAELRLNIAMKSDFGNYHYCLLSDTT